MLEKLVKEYGINRLAYELGLCELSIRKKISGKAKITIAELMAIQKLLGLTDEQVEEIKNAQSNNTGSGI